MEPRNETEVLVVGAGPVGMVTAACLARRGIGVRIVEQGGRPAARSYALALHPASLEIFQELGLAGTLIERGKIVDSVAYYEGERPRARIDLGALDSEFPFILVLAQSTLEETLARYLDEQEVFVWWNLRGGELEIGEGAVDAGLVKLDGGSAGYGMRRGPSNGQRSTDIHARFAVGADGYRSTVREALEIDYREVGSGQTYGVFELEADWKPEAEVRVVLDPRSTSVLWPLGDGRMRWSFELTDSQVSPPRAKRRLLMQMGEEAFPMIAQELLEDLIAERAPWFAAPVNDVTWSVAVKFDRRLVPRFGRDSAWLVGDAAHLAAPAGVHSMNVGFREARDLADGIHAILRQGASHDVLERFNDERLDEWERLLGLDGVPAISAEADEWTAVNASRILETIPASGEELQTLAAQIGLRV